MVAGTNPACPNIDPGALQDHCETRLKYQGRQGVLPLRQAIIILLTNSCLDSSSDEEHGEHSDLDGDDDESLGTLQSRKRKEQHVSGAESLSIRWAILLPQMFNNQ